MTTRQDINRLRRSLHELIAVGQILTDELDGIDEQAVDISVVRDAYRRVEELGGDGRTTADEIGRTSLGWKKPSDMLQTA